MLKQKNPKAGKNEHRELFAGDNVVPCPLGDMLVAKDPPAILMDETTSGLDPTSAQEFLAQLRRLREQGKAILMT